MLGWPQDKTVALIVGGGDGMGPVAETVKAVGQSGMDLALAVIAGRNESLKQNLENLNLKTPTFVYGFVDNMPDLMNAADILLTKAGPGTISEGFIAGLPLILYSKMPGQEDGNVDYVLNEGAGVWAPAVEDVLNTLRYWTANPEVLAEVAAISKGLAHPDASYDIAQEIINAVTPA
jgi:1,2-diacylglycerol 3-beta-galactosyltransferase